MTAMAKRFIDTGLFDDPWFMDLSNDGKLFWVYCITKCDHAGIIEINRRLAEFQTGINSLLTVIEELGNRLLRIDERLFFIPKFLEFQYPGFPNSKVRQQQSAVSILTKYGFIKDGKLTLNKELSNSYGNGNGTVNGHDILPTTLKEQDFNFEILKQNTQYLESIYRAIVTVPKRQISYRKFLYLTDVFIADQSVKSEKPKNEVQYRDHFVNWMKIQTCKNENWDEQLVL